MKENLLDQTNLTIVDVGAAGGLHDRWSHLKTSINSILFEPDPEEFKKLKLDQNNTSLVINSALSDQNKEVRFHVCKWQEVSSIYKPNLKVLSKYQDADRFTVSKVITLQADSLNNLLEKERVTEVDFIKIDTQGSELEILQGASNFLDGIIGLEVEVEFIKIYQDQPLFPEVDRFIESHGFSLIDMKRTFWKRKNADDGSNKGQLVYADALYLKEPEQVMKSANLSKEKIIKSINLYLVYGYVDLAISLLELARLDNVVSIDLNNTLLSLIKDYRQKKILKDFKGKERIKNFFLFFANVFSTTSFSSGTDRTLGN